MRPVRLLAVATVVIAVSGGAVAARAATPGWQVVPSPGDERSALVASDFLSASDGWAVGVTHGSSIDTDTLTEHWDGQAWRVVDSPAVVQSDERFYGVSFAAGNDGWAVGAQDPFGTTRVHGLLAHWDGARWRTVASPAGAGVPRGVDARAGDDVWAVGPNTFEHFDGSSWTLATSPSPTAHPAVVTALAANDVWAAGGQEDTRPGYHNDVPYLAHWNGHRWSNVTVPGPLQTGTLNAITAVNDHDVWAVGTVEGRQHDQQPVTLHFDGVVWQSVAAPAQTASSGLFGVAALGADDVWAVGFHDGHRPDGFAIWRTFAEHWDGHQWTVVNSPNDTQNDNSLGAASAAGGQVWAVGTDGNTLVERTTG